MTAQKYQWDSTLSWLKDKIEAGDFDLFGLVEELMVRGDLDADVIQDMYQSEMEEMGFFIATREWMLENCKTTGMIECVDCGDVFSEDDDKQHKRCKDSCPLEDGTPSNEHRFEEAAQKNVRDYLDEEFPASMNKPQEMWDFGVEKGWWE